jgi:hypothetical protein
MLRAPGREHQREGSFDDQPTDSPTIHLLASPFFSDLRIEKNARGASWTAASGGDPSVVVAVAFLVFLFGHVAKHLRRFAHARVPGARAIRLALTRVVALLLITAHRARSAVCGRRTFL